jgi:hypothetical protein
MPTQDSSSFTRQLKYNAVQARAASGGSKLITHLYTFVPNATALNDFLPSFSNKNLTDARTLTPLYISGLQYKSRKPSGSYMQD